MPSAVGDTARYGDPNDVKGPLDIKWVSQGHASSQLEHRIGTVEGWEIEDVSGDGVFVMFINMRSDDMPEEEGQDIDYCVSGTIKKRIRAHMIDCRSEFDGPVVGPVKVLHEKPKLLVLRFPESYLPDSGPYQWNVQTNFFGKGCPEGCPDAAPGVEPNDLDAEHTR